MGKAAHFFIFWLKLFFLSAILILILGCFLFKPLLASSLGIYWDADVSIQKIEVKWASSELILSEVRVGNPYGFPKGDLLEIDKVEIKWDKEFFEEGALKPQRMKLGVRRINLMRRVSGHLNLQILAYPEKPSNPKQGVRLAPIKTLVSVMDVNEVDISSPLIKKSVFSLSNREFEIQSKTSFRGVTQVFAKELFQRLGFNDEGAELAIPAPQYQGVAATLEQEIRNKAEEVAKQEAADAEFDALTTTSSAAAL